MGLAEAARVLLGATRRGVTSGTWVTRQRLGSEIVGGTTSATRRGAFVHASVTSASAPADFQRAWASTSTAAAAAADAGAPSAAEAVREDLRLTDACVRRLRELSSTSSSSSSVSDDGETLLRIAVDGGGCSGFQYSFSLDSHVGPQDKVFESDGAKVVVDDISFDFVKGATVDYVEEMIKSSFAITENPNSESSCGCGSSFVAK